MRGDFDQLQTSATACGGEGDEKKRSGTLALFWVGLADGVFRLFGATTTTTTTTTTH